MPSVVMNGGTMSAPEHPISLGVEAPGEIGRQLDQRRHRAVNVEITRIDL